MGSRSLYFSKSVEVILLRSQVESHSGRIWEKKEERRKSKETDRAARGQRDVRVVPCWCFREERGAARGAEPRSVV